MKSLILKFEKNTRINELPYRIYLNRDHVLLFPSKRKASDFVVLFQNNTNDCLRSLNFIMSDIYSKYLDFYFYLDTTKCLRIKNSVNSYNDRLTLFFEAFEIGNQSFKLTAFYCLFDYVEDIIFQINLFAKKSKNYQLVNSLNAHLKTISLLIKHFKETLRNENLSKDYKSNKLRIVHLKPLSKAL